MSKKGTVILLSLFWVVVGSIIFFTATPAGIGAWNSWFHDVQKVDDVTNYETKKQVEDTCRAMISSYESDKLTYEQYKDSENKEEHSWAEQAKMRANKTASSYNNYILQNTYVWKDNVPTDIKTELAIISTPSASENAEQTPAA